MRPPFDHVHEAAKPSSNDGRDTPHRLRVIDGGRAVPVDTVVVSIGDDAVPLVEANDDGSFWILRKRGRRREAELFTEERLLVLGERIMAALKKGRER